MPVFETECSECGKHLLRKHVPKTGRSFCDFECKANWQRRAKPVSKEWLIQKYVVEGLDCVQIAKLVDRDPKSVWNWMQDFGIELRKRGYASSDTWRKKGCVSTFKGRRHTEATKKRLSDIAKAEGRVPYDPAVGSYMKGRRGAEVHSWKGGITPQRQAFYCTVEWKNAVKHVWRRDNATCQRCGRKQCDDRSVSFDIHHIVTFACVELRADTSNLVLICEPCHYWVHSSLNVEKQFIKEIELHV